MTAPASPPQKSIARVIFWMSGALLCFSIMAVSLRGLSKILNVFEMLSIRSVSGVVILLGLAAVQPELRHLLRPRQMHLHLLRNTIHFAAQLGWAQAVVLLPLATVFALEFTSPIWVALLAVVFLREPLTSSRIATIALGFIGVLVVLRPGLASFQPASLLVLAAALGFAISAVMTKALTATQSTFAILFWMNAIQLPLNLAGSDPFFVSRLGPQHVLPALGVGLAGVASHYCLTNAFRYGDAVIVVPLDFLRVPLIALVGWWFYAEALDPFVFLGAGLIIAGIIWNLLAEARRTGRNLDRSTA